MLSIRLPIPAQQDDLDPVVAKRRGVRRGWLSIRKSRDTLHSASGQTGCFQKAPGGLRAVGGQVPDRVVDQGDRIGPQVTVHRNLIAGHAKNVGQQIGNRQSNRQGFGQRGNG